MQKRLTQALVAVALASVLLLGVGVLFQANLGARNEARLLVDRQLIAVAEIANNSADRGRAGTALARIADAFDLRSVSVITIGPEGRVVEILNQDRRVREALDDAADVRRRVIAELDQTQLAVFDTGESVLVDDDSSVIGLRAIEIDAAPLENANRIGVLVRRDVAAVGSQARRWFLLSAGLVVLLSIAAASWLARRFVAPVKAVTAATGAIATGDLSTRVDVTSDDELGELGRSVNRMASELERGQALEQQFLLSVSHDLRTPLTAISGYAEALTDGAVDDPERAGTIIRDHAGRLDRLVRDLLDLARLEARQFRLEPRTCNTTTVVSQAVDGVLPVVEQHALRLDWDRAVDVPDAVVDPDRLVQVLSNLIENAIKYATHTITLRVSDDNDGFVRIDVIDDGPGIPAEDLPHVFERLYVTQLRPIRAESSSGLGLAIVRELTAAMGGTVEASASNAGTVMSVRVPTVPPCGQI